MSWNRRRWLRWPALAAGLAPLASCGPAVRLLERELAGRSLPRRLETPAGAVVDADFHLLSRATFGPRPGDWEEARRMGREAWIDWQLEPEKIPDWACDLRAERFESLYFSAGDAFEFRKEVLRSEITRRAFLRAVFSRRQLFEVMVEFWTDHFNIDLDKGDCAHLKPGDDRDVIRRHALGRFRDLVRASATSPAMLVYLDGVSNKVRRGHPEDKPNENYARELLELHTLGVRGGYTQRDVLEAARCLTGWTFNRNRFPALNAGDSYFRRDWHDDGEKVVLGEVIPAGGGKRDLELLVDILCRHPSTARHVAWKLCRRFVSAEPPESRVDRCAAEFRAGDGDIRRVLRALFASAEFAQASGSLLKRPFHFIVSALRALDAETSAQGGLLEELQRMGQPLFRHPTPDGYPVDELPWTGTLVWRWNFALSLAAGKQAGARANLGRLAEALGLRAGAGADKILERWSGLLLGRAPTAAEREALEPEATAGGQERLVALLLASPAFQRY